MGAPETKKRIQNEVITLMASKRFDQIKVTEITNGLGIGRSTFYMYYDSTYAVIQDIEDTFFEQLNGFIDTRKVPFHDKYFEYPCPMILDALRMFDENRRLLATFLDERNGDPSFRYKARAVIKKHFYDNAVRDQYIKAPDALTEAYLVGGHFEMMVYSMTHGLEQSYEDAAVKIYTLMYRPFRPQ